MSNPALAAAAPSLIAMLQAIKQFRADLGPDPMQFPVTFGPAELKFLGTIGLQFPSLVSSEVGSLGTLVDSHIDSIIANLQKAAAGG